MQELDSKNKEYRNGVLAVLGCQLLWGLLPIYWHMLRPIDSWIIILYRIVLVALYAYLVAGFKYGFKGLFEPLKDRGLRRKYILAGIFVTANWSIYIWAVNSDNVVQSAIGYYIEPLVICAIGIIVFREKPIFYNVVAMGMASIAVVIILLHFGQLPWIGLMLALTFAVYSAIKKTVKQPAVVSLLYETMWFAPIALIAIIYLETHNTGAISVGEPSKYALLFLCGLFTLIPLGLFAHAATRVSLLLIGLTQYISPSLSLLCAIFLFKEDVDSVQFIAFGLIWLGLAFFTYGEFRSKKLTASS